jgi:outer membrane protein assembly factor BamA
MKKIQIFLSLLFLGHFIIYAQAASDSILFVHDIQVIGNSTTKAYVILREMSLKVGDTLTQEAIDHDRNNIYNLQLFNKVDIEYTVNQNQASVFVIVTERWYFIPYPVIGMKYRDLSKLFYGAGVMHQNFGGRNEKVFAMFALGYDRWFMLNYQNPKVTDDDDIFMGIALTIQKVHNLSSSYGEYENSNTFFRGTVGKRFGMYQTLYSMIGYEIWQVNEPLVGRTLSSSGRDAFITASVNYRYDTRNNREYTTDGTLVSLFLAKNGFGESEVNIVSASCELKQFFALNSESGLGIRTMGSFNWGGATPPYRHVFFGYDDRIRGHFYKSIEAENKVITTVELRLPIFSIRYLEMNFIKIPQFRKLRYGLYFGIFADAGAAWCRNQSPANQPWYSGYGAGFQFLLPYGFTIRTEVAMNNLGKDEFIIDFDTSF